jgi:hypothetical protein
MPDLTLKKFLFFLFGIFIGVIIVALISHLHITILSPEASFIAQQKTIYTCPGIIRTEHPEYFIGCSVLEIINTTDIKYGEQFLGLYIK